MKPGRFWFSEPSPYVTHDPKLGRTWRTSPQFIIISDGSWFGISVCIERTMQRSSTQLADIREDLADLDAALAELAELERRGNAAPVRRSVFSVIGIGFPANLASDGFGSKVSTCDAPPFMNRCRTRLALAGSGGFFGASGFDGSAALAPPADQPLRPAARSQGDRAHSHAAARQHFAPGEQTDHEFHCIAPSIDKANSLVSSSTCA